MALIVVGDIGSVAARVTDSASWTREYFDLTGLHSANSGDVGVGGSDIVVVADLF